MKILFIPVAEAGAENALHDCCRSVQPDLVYLYLPAGTGLAEPLYDALSVSYQVRVFERDALLPGVSEDVILSDLSSVLTEIRRSNPDAEIYLDTTAGTDAMQNAMIDLITATGLDLLPALSAETVQEVPPAEQPAPAQEESPAAGPETEPANDFHVDFTDPNVVIASDEIVEAPADAETAPEQPAEPSEAVEESAADAEEMTGAGDAPGAEPEAAGISQDEVDKLLNEQTEKVTASVTASVTKSLTAKLLSALIDAYDYTGALTLARSSADAPAPQFIALLEAVELRSRGRFMEAQQKCRACGQAALMPDASLAAEYYLILDLFLKRQDYTGFLRAVPPYLIELLIAAIRTKFSMDVTQYMIFGSRKWDHSKLMIGQMTGKFKESYTYHQKPKPGNLGVYVTTANLSNLIENLVVPRRDAQMMLDTLKLRLDIEEKTRTLASFTLRGATAEEIRAAGTHTPDELLQMILNYARNYTDIALSDEYLRAYDTAGDALKSMLN